MGVIDIGTLKIKLQIVKLASPNNLATVYKSNTLTCLGLRMHENNNRPKQEYLEQTFNELSRCKQIIEKEGVDKLRVVSTHALREMGDVGKEIAKQIQQSVGFNVEIISQEEEANLFFQAVTGDFPTKKDLTVVDIGGGSVQILIGNKNQLKKTFLLKAGAQYLHDTLVPAIPGKTFLPKKKLKE